MVITHHVGTRGWETLAAEAPSRSWRLLSRWTLANAARSKSSAEVRQQPYSLNPEKPKSLISNYKPQVISSRPYTLNNRTSKLWP